MIHTMPEIKVLPSAVRRNLHTSHSESTQYFMFKAQPNLFARLMFMLLSEFTTVEEGQAFDKVQMLRAIFVYLLPRLRLSKQLLNSLVAFFQFLQLLWAMVFAVVLNCRSVYIKIHILATHARLGYFFSESLSSDAPPLCQKMYRECLRSCLVPCQKHDLSFCMGEGGPRYFLSVFLIVLSTPSPLVIGRMHEMREK
jgi:hypothetical protein